MTDPATEPPPVPLQEAARLAGISYRQAHYWTQVGYIRATYRNPAGREAPGGSGTRAVVSLAELYIMRTLGRLCAAGIHPTRAAPLARKVGEGASSVLLGPGLTLVVEPDPVPAAEATVPTTSPCPVSFPGQELRCERFVGHEPPHRSGSIQWWGESWQRN